MLVSLESLRAFKEKMKLGRFADKDAQSIEKKEEEIAQNISLHSRCEVNLPGVPPKRGEVMFVGMHVYYQFAFLVNFC